MDRVCRDGCLHRVRSRETWTITVSLDNSQAAVSPIHYSQMNMYQVRMPSTDTTIL